MSQNLETKPDSDISTSTSPRVLTCQDTSTLYLKLNPTTSLCTGRYGKTETVEPSHTTVAPGLSTKTASLPPSWSSFIHPEGQRYYYRDDLKLRVVTEENMDDLHIATAVSFCVKWIEDTLWQRNIELPDSAELFLQLEDTQENSCNYYFVDHASRTEFWIDKMDTESLDMDPVVSASHLNLALEKLYWTHVEFFPMHLESRLPKDIVDSIIDVFSHGQADRMSSDSSTFPYTTDQCAQLLVLLNSRRGHNLNGYTICFVARLWNAICHHRFTSYYGQDIAQLDREQAMLPSDTPDHHGLTAACDWMLWNMPSFHIEKLNKLFVDNQVYVDQWCLVISACLSGWSSTLSRVSLALIADILLCMVPGASMTLALLSIVACCASITSGSVLLLRHQGLAEASASTAAIYLRDAKSKTYGFLPSAVIFSLPNALYMWSLGFLAVHVIFLMSHFFNAGVVITVIFLMVSMVCAILRFTSPDQDSSSLSQLLKPWMWFQRVLQQECSIV